MKHNLIVMVLIGLALLAIIELNIYSRDTKMDDITITPTEVATSTASTTPESNTIESSNYTITPTPSTQTNTNTTAPAPDQTTTQTPVATKIEPTQSVKTPITVYLKPGSAVELDGSVILTLLQLSPDQYGDRGLAMMRLTEPGGCGEGSDPGCVGPPGYQIDFTLSTLNNYYEPKATTPTYDFRMTSIKNGLVGIDVSQK